MSYSYRLNVEDIFFELGERHFQSAIEQVGLVNHPTDDGLSSYQFRGFVNSVGLASATIAIVGWATSLESFTNLIWNSAIAPLLPEGKIRDSVIRNFSTPDKLFELFKFYSFDLGKADWWPNIKKLFEFRNEFVHYKKDAEYQGFSFPPKIIIRLNESTLLALRVAVIACIDNLGRLADQRTEFIDGKYQFDSSCG